MVQTAVSTGSRVREPDRSVDDLLNEVVAHLGSPDQRDLDALASLSTAIQTATGLAAVGRMRWATVVAPVRSVLAVAQSVAPRDPERSAVMETMGARLLAGMAEHGCTEARELLEGHERIPRHVAETMITAAREGVVGVHI